MITLLPLCVVLNTVIASALASAAPTSAALAADPTPRVSETRTYRIRQTVVLQDVPAAAKEARLWVPAPADGAWQHVDAPLMSADARMTEIASKACAGLSDARQKVVRLPKVAAAK